MLCAKYDYDLDIQVKQEEAFANGEQKGMKKGIYQERINTAKRMLDKNCDISFIKEITSLSEEEIKKLKN